MAKPLLDELGISLDDLGIGTNPNVSNPVKSKPVLDDLGISLSDLGIEETPVSRSEGLNNRPEINNNDPIIPLEYSYSPKIEVVRPKQITGAPTVTTGTGPGVNLKITPPEPVRDPNVPLPGPVQIEPEAPISVKPFSKEELSNFEPRPVSPNPYLPFPSTMGSGSNEAASTAIAYLGGEAQRLGKTMQERSAPVPYPERGRELAESIGLSRDKIKGQGEVPGFFSDPKYKSKIDALNLSSEDREALYSYGQSVLTDKRRATGQAMEEYGKKKTEYALKIDPAWLKEDRFLTKIDKVSKGNPGVMNSLKLGDLGGATDIFVYDAAMSGDKEFLDRAMNVKRQFSEMAAEQNEKGASRSAFENFINKTAEIVPMMAKGAAVSAIPVVGPVVGQSIWARQGAGDMLFQMVEQGVPVDKAIPMATGLGAVYAGIEGLKVMQLMETGASSVLKNAIKNKIGAIVAQRGVNTLFESTEEAMQQVLTDDAVVQAMNAAGLDNGQKYELADALKSGLNAFTSSLGSFALLGGPAVGYGIGKQVLSNKKEKAGVAKNETPSVSPQSPEVQAQPGAPAPQAVPTQGSVPADPAKTVETALQPTPSAQPVPPAKQEVAQSAAQTISQLGVQDEKTFWNLPEEKRSEIWSKISKEEQDRLINYAEPLPAIATQETATATPETKSTQPLQNQVEETPTASSSVESQVPGKQGVLNVQENQGRQEGQALLTPNVEDVQPNAQAAEKKLSPKLDVLSKLPDQNFTKAHIESLPDDHYTASIDGDKFKAVNDTAGHAEGDRIIGEIGRLMKKYFSDKVIGREGGEEFFVDFGKEFTETDLKNLQAFRDEVEKTVLVNGTDPFTVSIGVGRGKRVQKDGNKRLTSDIAAYTAKNNGRNQIVVDNDKNIAYYKGEDVSSKKKYLESFLINQTKDNLNDLIRRGILDPGTAGTTLGRLREIQERKGPGEPVVSESKGAPGGNDGSPVREGYSGGGSSIPGDSRERGVRPDRPLTQQDSFKKKFNDLSDNQEFKLNRFNYTLRLNAIRELNLPTFSEQYRILTGKTTGKLDERIQNWLSATAESFNTTEGFALLNEIGLKFDEDNPVLHDDVRSFIQDSPQTRKEFVDVAKSIRAKEEKRIADEQAESNEAMGASKQAPELVSSPNVLKEELTFYDPPNAKASDKRKTFRTTRSSRINYFIEHGYVHFTKVKRGNTVIYRLAKDMNNWIEMFTQEEVAYTKKKILDWKKKSPDVRFLKKDFNGPAQQMDLFSEQISMFSDGLSATPVQLDLFGENKPSVIGEEEYLSQKGASRQDIGEAALHKNIPEGNIRKKLVEDQAKKDTALIEKRDELRKEYNDKVNSGEIRPPSRFEKLHATAQGMDELASVQAARAVLEKNGIDWQKPLEGQTPKKPAPKDTAAPKPQPSELTDFGEKIGGARKDYYLEYADKMKKAEEYDFAAEPLSKTWPEPDYEKMLEGGTDPWVVGFIHAARDEVPTKPQKGWKLTRWVENAKALRDFANKLTNGTISKERAKEALEQNSSVLSHVGGRGELYQIFGHEKSLKNVDLAKHHYSVYRGEKDVTKWIIEQRYGGTSLFSNMPRELGVGNTKEEAIADFKTKYDSYETTSKGERKTEFVVYKKRTDGKYYIAKKMGAKRYYELKRFDSAKEAFDYRKEHQAELEAQLERYKQIPSERREFNRERIGKDHRGGRDVTPEMFNNTFGFRGVEFGNWVNSNERQDNLNRAYDALYDLATILNIPTRAISLNGELGLGFGSRGIGGKRPPSAHYESDRIVINLTRKNGPGSLAHEWWHAFDNYISRNRGKGSHFITENPREIYNDKTRPELLSAFKKVVDAIDDTGLHNRSQNLDGRRSKDYWSTTIEEAARSFESYVIDKLKDIGATNDYLANIATSPEFAKDLAKSILEGGSSDENDEYPYLLDSELPGVKKAFDNLFTTIKTREENGKFPMFNKADSKESSLQDLKALENGVAGTIDRVLNYLPQGTKDRLHIQVTPTFNIRGRQFGEDGDWEMAVWYNPDGKVIEIYINPETPLDRIATGLNHELPGHIGSRLVYADNYDIYQKMQAFFKQQKKINEPSLVRIAKRYRAEMEMQPERSQEILFDEWSAHHLQRYLDEHARDSLATRIYGYFRGMLIKLGFAKETIDDVLRAMVKKMRGADLEKLGTPAAAFEKTALANTFFSPTLRAVQGLKQEKGTGEQFFNMITKAPGVKEAEWKWLGLDDFLKGRKMITKQEVENFIRENQVTIEETKLGEKNISFEEYFKNTLPDYYEDYKKDPESNMAQYAFNYALDRYNKEIKFSKSKARSNTKHSSYTLPDGENYREVLLTLPVLPEKKDVPQRIIPGKETEYEENKADVERYNKKWFEAQIAGNNPDRELYRQMRNDAEMRMLSYLEPDPTVKTRMSDPYQSSHWSEPNVIAHIRMNDRTTPDGEKVLFIEEIQSDWAREAREKGIKRALSANDLTAEHVGYRNWYTEPASTEPVLKKVWQVYDSEGMRFGNFTQFVADTEEEAKQKAIKSISETGAPLTTNGVPNQPFLKNWEELTLKRILRMAAEEGYDRIAWINGKQTADRYDLSKQIVQVQYFPGEKRLVAFDLNSDSVLNETGIEESDIEKYIGKGPAQKLIDSPIGKLVNPFGSDNQGKVIEGEGLKVGGEWAENLYDKMIPKFYEKYGKKWGVKVENISLGEKKQGMEYYLYDDEGEFISAGDGPFKTRAEAEARNRNAYLGAAEIGERKQEKLSRDMTSQQSIPITPEMHDSVLYEGQPMFQKREFKESQIYSDFFKAWFGDWENAPEQASKVVDENGKPLVVYHGTNSRFNEFKTSPGIGNQGGNDQIKGIYFTDNKEGASFFTNDEKGVKGAYLSLQNPLIVENKKMLKEKIGVSKLSEVDEEIKKLGYDGIIINKGMYANGGPHREFIAFSPKQIKLSDNDTRAFESTSENNRPSFLLKGDAEEPISEKITIDKEARNAEREFTLAQKADEEANNLARSFDEIAEIEKEISTLRRKLRSLPLSEEQLIARAEIAANLNKINSEIANNKLDRLHLVKNAIYNYARSIGMNGIPYNQVDTLLKNSSTSTDLSNAIARIDKIHEATLKRTSIENLNKIIEREYRRLQSIKQGKLKSTTDTEANLRMEQYLNEITRVPSETKEQIDKLLAGFNQYGKNQKKTAEYVSDLPQEVVDWMDDPTKPVPDYINRAIRSAFAANLETKSTRELNQIISDIQSIKKTGRTQLEEEELAEKKMIEERSQLIADQIMATTKEKPKTDLEEALDKKRLTSFEYFKKLGQKGFWGLIDAERMTEWLVGFKKPGLIKSTILQPLYDAEAEKIRSTEKVLERFREIHSKMNMSEALSKPFYKMIVQKLDEKGDVVSSKEISLSIDNMMFVYANSKNDGNRAHLEGTGLTNAMIKEIVDALPQEYKDAVDAQIDYFDNEQYGRMNEVFRRERRIDMPHEKDYFPIQNLKTDRAESAVVADYLARNSSRLAGVQKGMTKTRVMSKAPFRQMSYFNSVVRNLVQTEHYIAYNDAVRRVQQYLNNKTLRKAITDKNEQVYTELKEWLKGVSYGRVGGSEHPFDKLADLLRKNYATYVLGFKLTTALMQLSSLPKGMAMVNTGVMVKSIAAFMANPVEAIKFADSKSAHMAGRMKSYERELSEMAEDATLRGATKSENPLQKLKDLSMFHIGIIDKAISVMLWNGKYEEVYKATGSEDEAIRAADEVVRKTQSRGGVLFTPSIYRGGGLARAYTMFTSDLNQNINILFELAGKWKLEPTPDNLAKIFWYFIIPSIMIYMIQNAFKPDRPEEAVKTFITQFSGGIPFLGQLIDSGVAMAADESKELRGIIPDKSWKQYAMNLVPTSFSFIESLGKGIGNKNPTAVFDALMQLSGIPWSQAKRITHQGKAALQEKEWRLLFWPANTLKEQTVVSSMVRRALHPRPDSNDTEVYAKWYKSADAKTKAEFKAKVQEALKTEANKEKEKLKKERQKLK